MSVVPSAMSLKLALEPFKFVRAHLDRLALATAGRSSELRGTLNLSHRDSVRCATQYRMSNVVQKHIKD